MRLELFPIRCLLQLRKPCKAAEPGDNILGRLQEAMLPQAWSGKRITSPQQSQFLLCLEIKISLYFHPALCSPCPWSLRTSRAEGCLSVTTSCVAELGAAIAFPISLRNDAAQMKETEENRKYWVWNKIVKGLGTHVVMLHQEAQVRHLLFPELLWNQDFCTANLTLRHPLLQRQLRAQFNQITSAIFMLIYPFFLFYGVS